jgi:thiol-disulfide isomerase/thioredoxin
MVYELNKKIIMKSSFYKTYKAEGIKLKNTYIYILSFFLGLIIPTLYLVFTIFTLDDFNKEIYPGFNILETIFDKLSGTYLGFFYIITLILACSRLSQIDFKNNTWQLVETLPTSKFNIYFSKVLRIVSILITGILSFILSTIVISLLLYLMVKNKEQVSLALPIVVYLQYITKTMVASLFAISVLFFVSTRFSNFIFTMLLGFALLLAYPILKAFQKLPKWDMYKLIYNVTDAKSDLNLWFTYSDYVSFCIAIPIFILGYLWYKDKTFKQAFIINKKQLLSFIPSLLIFWGLAIYLLVPKQQLPSNSTVVQGDVEVDFLINTAYLIDPVLEDTLATSAINNNTFTLKTDKNLALGNYKITVDNKIAQTIFMGNHDLISIQFKKQGSNNTIKILGTRIAENSLSPNAVNFSGLVYYLNNSDRLENTEYYFSEIEKQYKSNSKELVNGYTSDNYIPRNDYLDMQKKNIAIQTLLLYKEYESKYKLAFNKPLPQNTFIEELEKTIVLGDETMVTNPDYIDYIKYTLIKDDNSDLDEESKFLNQIIKLPNSDFKDRLLYTLAKESIENTKNAEKIEANRSQFENQFYNKKVQANFEYKLAAANRMATGNTAPIFLANTPQGKTYSLADFSGKYVVIDVWATWCGPCKIQSPKFDKVANSYKNNENVVFIALSVDEKLEKWLVDVADKKVNVMQLHSNNLNEFSKQYNVTAIPRFILIGKNGELLNSNLPFPDTDEFEIVLKESIKD